MYQSFLARSLCISILFVSCSRIQSSKDTSISLEVPNLHLSTSPSITSDKKQPSQVEIEEKARRVFIEHLDSRDEMKVSTALQALSLCHHPLAIDILSKRVLDDSPFIQLASVQALANLKTERARDLLQEALKSPYLAVRLEAIWNLIDLGDKRAIYQIDALKTKFPEETALYLPLLYAKEGSPQALQELYKMAYEMPDPVVNRIFLALSQFKRIEAEEFILSYTSHSPIVLEAQAEALELIPGDKSLKKLQALSKHNNPFVRLRAIASRISIGDETALDEATREYLSGNKMILSALLSTDNPKKLPVDITVENSSDITTILYLVMTQDPKATSFLSELLSPSKGSKEGIVISPSVSPGGTFTVWRYTLEPQLNFQERVYLREHEIELKETILRKTITLGHEPFLKVAHHICKKGDIDLYPALFDTLLEMPHDEFQAFCSEYSHTPGAPLLRSYISLYTMKRQKKLESERLLECFQLASSASNERESENFRLPIPWITKDPGVEAWLSQPHDESSLPLQATSRLYLLSCQLAVELAGNNKASEILMNEVSKAPSDMAPFVIAALLEISM